MWLGSCAALVAHGAGPSSSSRHAHLRTAISCLKLTACSTCSSSPAMVPAGWLLATRGAGAAAAAGVWRPQGCPCRLSQLQRTASGTSGRQERPAECGVVACGTVVQSSRLAAALCVSTANNEVICSGTRPIANAGAPMRMQEPHQVAHLRHPKVIDFHSDSTSTCSARQHP